MEKYIALVLVLLIIYYTCVYIRTLPTGGTTSRPQQLNADKSQTDLDPSPAVVPITSMGLIRSHLPNFIMINLPLDHSASLTYSACTNIPSDAMFCPKQGGVFLVQYDPSGMARFVSFVSQMDDYNNLAASGVPTTVGIALPSSAIYMGEFKPTA